MSASIILLLVITFLYAGYNLLIKVSSSYVPVEVSSTIFATITLQVAALLISCLFAAGLIVRGAASLALPPPAYLWAALAGLCIGVAEIAYFYLFRGVASAPPMPANIAIPIIVSGTIVVAVIIAWLLFREPMTWQKALGTVLIVAGVATIYLDREHTGIIGA